MHLTEEEALPLVLVYLKQGKKPDPSPDFTAVDVATLCCFEIITWFSRVHTNMPQLQKHVCVSLESDLPFLLHTPASFPADFMPGIFRRAWGVSVLKYHWLTAVCLKILLQFLLSCVDEQRTTRWGSTFISIFLPFILVPVILGSNSKPVDIKEKNFTRAALRHAPAQGEMPSLSHRTSTRQ